MDWANTQYVRVYIGDSRDWLAFGWEGRALFTELLRASDRAGLLDYEGEQDMGILADQVRMPIEVVERALPRLLARGSVVHREGKLIIRNKIKAQETAQSPAQRTREYRARLREVRLAEALFGDETSQHGVTKRHESVTSGDVEKRRVTLRDPELMQSYAEQSYAEQSPPLPPGGKSAGADGETRNRNHAAHQLGVAVTLWLNGFLKKRFKPNSNIAQEAGRRWKRQGWDRDVVQGAIELRITELELLQSFTYLLPGTLYNTRLAIHVERHRQGVTPAKLRAEFAAKGQRGNGQGDHDRQVAMLNRQFAQHDKERNGQR